MLLREKIQPPEQRRQEITLKTAIKDASPFAYNKQQHPCMENQPKLSGRFHQGARMKRVEGSNLSALPLPPVPSWPAPSTETFPSAHLNPHDNRNRPHYYSRLAGGYLLLTTNLLQKYKNGNKDFRWKPEKIKEKVGWKGAIIFYFCRYRFALLCFCRVHRQICMFVIEQETNNNAQTNKYDAQPHEKEDSGKTRQSWQTSWFPWLLAVHIQPMWWGDRKRVGHQKRTRRH